MTRADDTAVPDYLARLRLDGQAALVVGAGQGNGRQTAHALAQAGASVVCVDIEDDRAQDIADEVGGIACVADARTREGVEQMVESTITAFGRLDHVVDIVGMARYGPLTEVTDEDWDWTFAMVLRHARLLIQVAGPEIARHGGGTMTFVASVSAFAGAPYHGAYGAAKAGLLSLVRTAAVELGPQGVRVNAIAPGQIRTPRIIAQMEASGAAAARRPTEPLGKLGETPDIAGAALYLTAPLSSHVTGHCLVVDGGATANFAYPLEAPPAPS